MAGYLDGTIDTVDSELAEMLDQIESEAIQGHKRFREGGGAAAEEPDEGGVSSATPKPYAQKTRVKRLSRFKMSPIDDTFIVTADQEDVYKKLMLSTSNSRSSNIKE